MFFFQLLCGSNFPGVWILLLFFLHFVSLEIEYLWVFQLLVNLNIKYENIFLGSQNGHFTWSEHTELQSIILRLITPRGLSLDHMICKKQTNKKTC